jgi:hypothetical protein
LAAYAAVTSVCEPARPPRRRVADRGNLLLHRGRLCRRWLRVLDQERQPWERERSTGIVNHIDLASVPAGFQLCRGDFEFEG